MPDPYSHIVDVARSGGESSLVRVGDRCVYIGEATAYL